MTIVVRVLLILLVCACPCIIRGFSIAASSRQMESNSAAKAPTRPTSDDVPEALVEHAVAWASANGLGMVVKEERGLFTSTHLPFSLLPYGK